MTTAAEYAALAATEANIAATAAVNVQNKVAIAESSANLATNYANTVGASVTAAANSSTTAALKAIESENYRDLALLWGNADPNVVVEDNFYSARHYAQLTVGMLAVMQANLDTHSQEYINNKTVTDAALAYLGYRLDNGILVFDSTTVDGAISTLENNVNTNLALKINTSLYDSDKLELANFAKSKSIGTNNNVIDYLDEAGQIALQAMITSASNQTKLSYAGIIIDANTGNITSAAGTAAATEYGIRLAAVEETIGSSVQPGLGTIQAKYTIKTNANGHVAGFGLVNTANTDITSSGFSEFIVNADSFKVSSGTSSVAPFRVITDGGVTNGGVCVTNLGAETGGILQADCLATSGNTWFAPGMYVDNAYIMNLAVASSLTIGQVNAAISTNADPIGSAAAAQAAAIAASDSAGSAAAAQALAAADATTKVATVTGNIYVPGTTMINGNLIQTGTVIADNSIAIGTGYTPNGYAVEVATNGNAWIDWITGGIAYFSNQLTSTTSTNVTALTATTHSANPAIWGKVNFSTSSTAAHAVRGTNYHSGGTRVQTSGLVGSAANFDFYAEGAGTNYGPFTGAHDCLVANNKTVSIGDLVVDVACIIRKGLSNTLFSVEASSTANQAAVIGVIVSNNGTLADGAPAAGISYIDDDGIRIMSAEYETVKNNYKLFAVNSVGEGQINVIGETGDLAAGDLIVASSSTGRGMKQSDNIIRSHTVARVRESVSFSSVNEVKLAACIYLCG